MQAQGWWTVQLRKGMQRCRSWQFLSPNMSFRPLGLGTLVCNIFWKHVSIFSLAQVFYILDSEGASQKPSFLRICTCSYFLGFAFHWKLSKSKVHHTKLRSKKIMYVYVWYIYICVCVYVFIPWCLVVHRGYLHRSVHSNPPLCISTEGHC